MEAKEKAMELIAKFRPHVMIWDGYNDRPEPSNHAKLAAIIAVDEIINSHYPDYELYKYEIAKLPYDYWQEVKKELEKL